MSTDAFLTLFGARNAREPRDPMKAAQSGARSALRNRFYKDASLLATETGFALHLDGKSALTPGRNALAIDDARVATALMWEWTRQGDAIDPATMPLTRLMNSAIDGVAVTVDAVRAEIRAYASSDLICYRADTPQELAERQAKAWDPLCAWARQALGARLILAAGVMHIAQPPETVAALEAAVDAMPAPFALAGLSTVTSLTGSLVLGLALRAGAVSADQAWSAAHVDETYQAQVWGPDAEAALRMANRRREFDAAVMLLQVS